MPHALQRFIVDQMDRRTWKQADLVRESKLSRAHVSKLLGDDRALLPQLPRRETIDGLAKAFGLAPGAVLAVAIEALGMGFTSNDFVYEIDSASDEDLLDAVRSRMQGPGGGRSRRLLPVSDPPDRHGVALAADERDQSIAGEQEESDTP